MNKLDELTEALYKWVEEAGVPGEERDELVARMLEFIDEELGKVKEND